MGVALSTLRDFLLHRWAMVILQHHLQSHCLFHCHLLHLQSRCSFSNSVWGVAGGFVFVFSSSLMTIINAESFLLVSPSLCDIEGRLAARWEVDRPGCGCGVSMAFWKKDVMLLFLLDIFSCCWWAVLARWDCQFASSPNPIFMSIWHALQKHILDTLKSFTYTMKRLI